LSPFSSKSQRDGQFLTWGQIRVQRWKIYKISLFRCLNYFVCQPMLLMPCFLIIFYFLTIFFLSFMFLISLYLLIELSIWLISVTLKQCRKIRTRPYHTFVYRDANIPFPWSFENVALMTLLVAFLLPATFL